MKLNFGPGKKWNKPTSEWLTIDIEPYANIQVNFQEFNGLDFPPQCCEAVYGSHVFEHISIFKAPFVFSEIARVLKKGCVFRLVIPDVKKSILHYLQGDNGIELFDRRRKRAKKQRGVELTYFECLKEDFLSPSGQPVLGKNALAHQNAWDMPTIAVHLHRAGFSRVFNVQYGESITDHFDFETTYKSEAQQQYRSLYIEAIK